MSTKLDRIVKGVPPPSSQLSDPPSASLASAAASHTGVLKSPTVQDPTTLLPSSPPQIYLNLLVLEASLRAQYLTLRSRRRQNTLVLTVMTCWTLGHAYWLLLPNPGDASAVEGHGINGSGGGSVGTTGYWLMDVWATLALMSGLVTMVLFWGTGQWERGVRWPRRWVGIANRGLRVFNCKIVVLRGPLWRDLLDHLAALLIMGGGPTSYPTRRPRHNETHSGHSSETGHPHSQLHHHRQHSGSTVSTLSRQSRDYVIVEEDLTPGGDHIKLLLLSKPFSPDFRQDWETYRAAYWERENERRAEMRRKLRLRRREQAKQQGGWLWWTGWRGWPRAVGRGSSSSAEHRDRQDLLQPHHAARRRASGVRHRSGSISHSSRSSTPSADYEEGRMAGSRPSSMVMLEQMERRWSAGSAASARRKKAAGPAGTPTNRSTRPLASGGSRPGTPVE